MSARLLWTVGLGEIVKQSRLVGDAQANHAVDRLRPLVASLLGTGRPAQKVTSSTLRLHECCAVSGWYGRSRRWCRQRRYARFYRGCRRRHGWCGRGRTARRYYSAQTHQHDHRDQDGNVFVLQCCLLERL